MMYPCGGGSALGEKRRGSNKACLTAHGDEVQKYVIIDGYFVPVRVPDMPYQGRVFSSEKPDEFSPRHEVHVHEEHGVNARGIDLYVFDMPAVPDLMPVHIERDVHITAIRIAQACVLHEQHAHRTWKQEPFSA